MADRLAVIILNYRTAEMTIACADAALADLPPRSRLIVVENGSGDGSDEALSRWHDGHERRSEIDLVISAVNEGFSGGNNLGLRRADADYCLLLNSDAVIQPGALGRMLSAGDAHPEAGLLHPTLTDPDGTVQISRFRRFTPLTELVSASNLGVVARACPGAVTAIELDDKDEPHWVSFAAILLRGRMIDEIGLMDDGFFLYYEDSEYCERARRAGWTIRPVAQATVIHHRGGSSPVKSLTRARKRLPAYFYESRSRYYRLLYGQGGLFLANLLWYAGRGLSYLRLLALKRPAPVCEQAGRDIWRGFFSGKDR